MTHEDLFDLFSKFGPVRYAPLLLWFSCAQNVGADMPYSQVRAGITANTKGTAFVVFQDVMDAKQACDKLNGFNFQGRYLVVLYHQPEKMQRAREDLETRKEDLERLKQQHGID